ncbi:MAG: hypothetical protein ACKOZZ_12145, partial [Bacteroidota bacterium]
IIAQSSLRFHSPHPRFLALPSFSHVHPRPSDDIERATAATRPRPPVSLPRFLWANIPVHYVFIVRNSDQWTKPVIIRQDYLLDYLQN